MNLAGLFLLVLSTLAPSGRLRAQRLHVATRTDGMKEEVGGNALPGSQPLQVTVRLGTTAAQKQDLDALLAAQVDQASPSFHHWLTPGQFRQRFGWSDEERQRLIEWLTANGLTLDAGSTSPSRLSFTAPASAAQRAFSVSLRSRPYLDGAVAFLNSGTATLPATFAAHIQSVSGLDSLPELPAGHLVSLVSSAAMPMRSAEQQGATAEAPPPQGVSELLSSLEDAVEGNASPVLVLQSTLCAAQLSSAERVALERTLEQAQVQGITVLVQGSCANQIASDAESAHSEGQPFPAPIAAVTALASSGTAASTASAPTGEDQRPAWQVARGLPADHLRHAPDFAVSSTATLAGAVLTLVRQTGNRLGSLSPMLYALQKSPGLFTRGETTGDLPDSVVRWTESDGLGTLDIQTLLRVYPHGSYTTTTSLESSSYAVKYGDALTLTAKVTAPNYGTTSPTGTVTFTSATQGVLGSATIDSTGAATLTPDALPVGTYTVVASYSGDSVYGSSSSTSKVLITVSIANATLSATLAPAATIPYGANATVTATVALPGASAAPSGVVAASIQGVAGATSSAVLSPNAGGNTATANIVLPVPPPSTTPYTIQVTCVGNTNFQCQTPALLTLLTSKGSTNTTVSVSPAAPQAGQPVTFTASVASAGSGAGTYHFTGSVSFYDSGKLIATAPVGTNQATASKALSGNVTHNIVAIYSGDANWNSSTSSPAAVAPTILPDALTLSSNVASGTSLAGVNIIFNALASSDITYGTGLTGTVTVYDTFNNTVIALGSPATVVPNGPTAAVAVLSTTGLLPGTHRIYAMYSGDANYAPATSPVLTLTLSDFSLSMTPSTLTMSQGKTQQVAMQVNASGVFAGAVSLGCVPPASSQATCSFSPTVVTGTGTSVLTITTAPSTSALAPSSGRRLWSAASGASLAMLLLLVAPVRSRRLPGLLTLLCASALTLSGLGCTMGTVGSPARLDPSGAGPGAGDSSGTPLGTQTFTITAAASDGVNMVRHTLHYQVTVQ